MPDAIAAMKSALAALSAGQVRMPVRTHIDFPERSGTTLVMPACVRTAGQEALAVKVVSVFANNPDRDLPRIMAAVTVYDASTGQLLALLEGTTITAIRTAAASAAATDILARPDSRTLAVIGAGVQARSHIQAVQCVRPLERILLCSRTRASSQQLAGELARQNPDGPPVEVVEEADDAVALADIVCTVTTATRPLFDAGAVRPGTHLNAVGSYQPHVVEIPEETVRQAKVWVDHRESALQEAGDLIQPLRSGTIDPGHVLGEIGEVLLEQQPGRTAGTDITLFKSVGNAAEDCLAAATALARAGTLDLGTRLPW